MKNKIVFSLIGLALQLTNAGTSYARKLVADYDVRMDNLTAYDLFDSQDYSLSGTLYSGGRAEITLKFAANKYGPEFTLTLPQACDNHKTQGFFVQNEYIVDFKICDLSQMPKDGVLANLDRLSFPHLLLPLICDRWSDSCVMGIDAGIKIRAGDHKNEVRLNPSRELKMLIMKRK